MELISVITPSKRPEMLYNILCNFFSQSYPHKELIVVCTYPPPTWKLNNVYFQYTPNPLTIGAARNLAVSLAQGSRIVQMDDDDFYSHNWLNLCSGALDKTPVSGCHSLFFYLLDQKVYKWTAENMVKSGERDYAPGATLAYHKDFWANNKFQEWNKIGEDDYFTQGAKNKVTYIEDTYPLIAMLHNDHTETERRLRMDDSPYWAQHPELLEDFKQFILPHKDRFKCLKTFLETPG